MSIFLDTCIPMYAAGNKHPYQKSCQEIIAAAAAGEMKVWTNTEVFQEILYRFFHIKEKQRGFELFDSFYKIMEGQILSVTAADTFLARELAGKYSKSGFSPRDLIHLAVMINNGINKIITTDSQFSRVNGIQIITPVTELIIDD